jgi:uncharacterized lipoprotein YmbA
MTTEAFTRTALVLVLFLSPVLVGCSASKTPQFYTLSSLPAPEGSSQTSAHGKDLAVGVGSVAFPEYLDRPQIVTRVGENELEIAEFYRWAEPLRKDFSRTLAENLAALLGTEVVVVLPWSRTIPLDHHLVMSVIRFEGRPGGNVELVARWGFLEGEDKTLKGVRKSSISEPTDGSTYETLVAAHSRALAKLSREIASAIAERSQ